MATRKQVITGLLISFTVAVMLFFLTSDYSLNFSFSANSHPLKLQHGYTTPHGKFFAQEDIEVRVYEGEEGEVVPDALTPTAFASLPPVVTLNTGDQLTEEMMRDMLAGDEEEEEEPDILKVTEEGMGGREFPQVEINHAENESVWDSTTSETTTTAMPTTEVPTTMETTSTTTPTPAPTTSFSLSSNGGSNRKFLQKGHIVAKRHIMNMIQTTARTETQSTTPTSGPTSVKSTEQAVTGPVKVPATEAVGSTNTTATEAVSTSKQTEALASPEEVVTNWVNLETSSPGASKPATSGTAAVTSGTVTSAVPVSEAPTTDHVTTDHVPAVDTTSSTIQSSESSEEKSQGGNSSHVNEVMSHVNLNQDNVVVKEMDLPEEFQSEETNETLIY